MSEDIKISRLQRRALANKDYRARQKELKMTAQMVVKELQSEEQKEILHEEQKEILHEEQKEILHEEQKEILHEEQKEILHEEQKEILHEEQKEILHEEQKEILYEEQKEIQKEILYEEQKEIQKEILHEKQKEILPEEQKVDLLACLGIESEQMLTEYTENIIYPPEYIAQINEEKQIKKQERIRQRFATTEMEPSIIHTESEKVLMIKTNNISMETPPLPPPVRKVCDVKAMLKANEMTRQRQQKEKNAMKIQLEYEDEEDRRNIYRPARTRK